MSIGRSLKLLFVPLLAVLAVAVQPAWALDNQFDIEINEFQVISDNTQAGASPNVRIIMRFCGPGLHVVDASNTTPIVVTPRSHGLAFDTAAWVIGVRGTTSANRAWQPVPFAGARPVPGNRTSSS